MNSHAPSYRGYRFPPEIISHAVWLYHRFCLSFRDVEDLLAARGIMVTYEAIRLWCLKFGPKYRQAEELCSSASNHHAVGRSRYEPILEQSGGNLPRADATAGARHAKVQVHGSSTTVLISAWDHPESFPCRTPAAAGSQLPNAANSCLRCLERSRVCLTISTGGPDRALKTLS